MKAGAPGGMWSLWDHEGGMGSPPMFLRELGGDSKVRCPLTFGTPGGRASFRSALPQPLPQFEARPSQE